MPSRVKLVNINDIDFAIWKTQPEMAKLFGINAAELSVLLKYAHIRWRGPDDSWTTFQPTTAAIDGEMVIRFNQHGNDKFRWHYPRISALLLEAKQADKIPITYEDVYYAAHQFIETMSPNCYGLHYQLRQIEFDRYDYDNIGDPPENFSRRAIGGIKLYLNLVKELKAKPIYEQENLEDRFIKPLKIWAAGGDALLAKLQI